MRGLRLTLLLEPGELKASNAIIVSAAAQAAAMFTPVRAGELVLPWFLANNTRKSFSQSLGTLLAARTLDFATLGIWAGTAILAISGLGRPIALAASCLLLATPFLLPAILGTGDRLATRMVAPRGRRGRRWTRRLRRVRRELVELRRRPVRLAAACLKRAPCRS